MTTHETLKEICDMIWYESETIKYSQPEFDEPWEFYKKYTWEDEVDEREIIFDPVFMEKFTQYFKNQKLYTDERQNQIDNWDRENYIPDSDIEMQCDYMIFWILDHLHDPTSYLANLLWIWQK